MQFRVGTVSSHGGEAAVQAVPLPTAILCHLYFALRQIKPAAEAGPNVSLPMPTVSRPTGHDRLLTLQSGRLPSRHGVRSTASILKVPNPPITCKVTMADLSHFAKINCVERVMQPYLEVLAP